VNDFYAHEIAMIAALPCDVVEADDIGVHAIEYAVRGWRVFPLRGKIPAIAGGRGVLDATTDLDQIATWWSGRYAGANIGVRLPDPVMVVDVDPRNGGAESLARLLARYGPLPPTLTAESGRGDGGCHRYFRRPAGKTSSKLLGGGIDLKTNAGYVVAPPSVHPDSGQPYAWSDRSPIADPPGWLVDLIRPPAAPPSSGGHNGQKGHNLWWGSSSPSPADVFTTSTTWAQILDPHGWRCLDPDGDGDGARWLHPTATSACSATVRHGCLFVYSDNTVFEPTVAGDPHGLTRFRAHAVLNHRGDLGEAARAFRLTGAA